MLCLLAVSASLYENEEYKKMRIQREVKDWLSLKHQVAYEKNKLWTFNKKKKNLLSMETKSTIISRMII